MSRTYKPLPNNPKAAETAISQRITSLADERSKNITQNEEARIKERGEWIQRLRRELAYRRLLSRIFRTQPNQWILKGGVSLLFRLEPNRASYDIDIAYAGDELDQEIALTKLTQAANALSDDWFVFELGKPRRSSEQNGVITIPVVARIGAKQFSRFSVDLPKPRADLPAEKRAIKPLGIGFRELEEIPEVQMLPLEAQIADKVCATFESYGGESRFSSRSRDLADLALIATQYDFSFTALDTALREEEKRREESTLQNGLPKSFLLPKEQEESWRVTWSTGARKPPIDFDRALSIVSDFIAPLLSEDRKESWSHKTLSWK